MAAIVGLWLAMAPATLAQAIAPGFSGSYSLNNLGSAAGVPGSYGGLTLLYNDPNVLLIGGNANGASGGIYAVNLIRGAGNHITGFSGSATLYATAPNIDGGLAYGPGNVLFFTRYPSNGIGEIKPGSSSPDKLVTLSGVASSVGSVAFVPAGFPGAGTMKIASYSGGGFYEATLTPDGSGTYDVGTGTLQATTGSGPEGLAYIPAGSPLFSNPSMLISEYSGNRVSAYTLDANGAPIPGSRQDFVTGLSGAEGAFVDPLTGDFLFSTFGSGSQIYSVQGFTAAVPEPGSLLLGLCLTGVGATFHALRRRGRGNPA
ncbi:MAG: hypothetical protein U0794_15480 [Isosphaeraceae bacterium]